MITVYGLRNCDRCRAAVRWLDSAGVAYRFHDLRADGLSGDLARDWIERVGRTRLINRRSTSWRALADAQRRALDGEDAASVLVAVPTLVKRPVIDLGGSCLVGFDKAVISVLEASPGAGGQTPEDR